MPHGGRLRIPDRPDGFASEVAQGLRPTLGQIAEQWGVHRDTAQATEVKALIKWCVAIATIPEVWDYPAIVRDIEATTRDARERMPQRFESIVREVLEGLKEETTDDDHDLAIERTGQFLLFGPSDPRDRPWRPLRLGDLRARPDCRLRRLVAP